MRPLSDLLPRVMPHLPGASTLLAAQMLADAAIAFIAQTKCYRATLDPIDIVANQSTYAIPAPTGYTLLEPYHVEVNGLDVWPTSEDALDLSWNDPPLGGRYTLGWDAIDDEDATPADWRHASAAQPRWYLIVPGGSLRLVGTPNAAYTGTAGLTITAAWKPTIDVTQIDESVFDRYHAALVAGALARALIVPKQPWSNAQLAGFHGEQFEQAISDAAAAEVVGHQRTNRPAMRTVAVA